MNNLTFRVIVTGCAIAFVALVQITTASAQQAGATPTPRIIASSTADPNTYGTASTIIHNLQPEDFAGLYSFFSASSSFVTASGGSALDVWAPLHLPNGAVVDSFEYFYHDESPAHNPTAALDFRNTLGQQTEVAPVNFFPNVSNGHNSLLAVLQTPVTINNLTTHYSVRFSVRNVEGLIVLKRVRVRYRLQVSPAPGTATFADVPVGDPLHRFVEALVASGITAGCGGGNFCPNAPLTRGQMAVFLAAALGLHWPN